MWVNPSGVAFAHIRRSDLIRIDCDGKVLDGGKNRLVNRAALVIHVAGKLFPSLVLLVDLGSLLTVRKMQSILPDLTSFVQLMRTLLMDEHFRYLVSHCRSRHRMVLLSRM